MRGPKNNLQGNRYGRLLVGRYLGNRFWETTCECGTSCKSTSAQLTSGSKVSCGCYLREQQSKAGKKRKTHGGRLTPEYYIWVSMRQRCCNEQASNFADYGGRGISVCDRWGRFENFIADIGLRPSSRHQIDRIDNNGNYEPGNVRWVLSKDNNRNRRSNLNIEFRGETLTLTAWCERLGLTADTVWKRIQKYGWSVEKALTTPIRVYGDLL